MRFVMVGASAIAVMTARMLTEDGHEVVIVERDAEKIDKLSEELDCGFVHGDGSRPAILRDISPENTQTLFCLSNSDQDNIIASLVGKSLGFERIVTKIEDPDFENVCQELGLEDVIVPNRRVAESLSDIARGQESLDLSSVIKGGLRFFRFEVGSGDASAVGEIDLPENTKMIAVTRKNNSVVATPETKLKKGDDAVLVTTEELLHELEERFGKSQDD